jgi:hypothetical protein
MQVIIVYFTECLYDTIFRDYVLSQETDSLKTATNTARAMWKRKFPTRQTLLKLQNISINQITSDI